MTLITESPGFCGLGDTASRGSGSFSFTFRSSGSCGKSSECSVSGDEIVAASWVWSTPFTGCILLLLPCRKFSSSLASFCRETLEMGVFQGVRAYAEALEWLSWLRSGTDQEGKKVSRRVRGGRNRHK